MLTALVLVALLGWSLAGYFALSAVRRPPIDEPPAKAVLVNAAGVPESLFSLRGTPPESYTRPHGRGVATIYRRVGIAAVYQSK